MAGPSLRAPAFRSAVAPLAAVAALARGEVVPVFARRLLEEGELDRWRGLRGEGLILVMGAEVPWVDGLTWLGEHPDAPGLHLPCYLEPDLHPALIARALRRLGHSGPVAVLPEARLTIALGGARPIARDWLEPLARERRA